MPGKESANQISIQENNGKGEAAEIHRWDTYTVHQYKNQSCSPQIGNIRIFYLQITTSAVQNTEDIWENLLSLTYKQTALCDRNPDHHIEKLCWKCFSRDQEADQT